jgi:hypothetical protein
MPKRDPQYVERDPQYVERDPQYVERDPQYVERDPQYVERDLYLISVGIIGKLELTMHDGLRHSPRLPEFLNRRAIVISYSEMNTLCTRHGSCQYFMYET